MAVTCYYRSPGDLVDLPQVRPPADPDRVRREVEHRRENAAPLSAAGAPFAALMHRALRALSSGLSPHGTLKYSMF